MCDRQLSSNGRSTHTVQIPGNLGSLSPSSHASSVLSAHPSPDSLSLMILPRTLFSLLYPLLWTLTSRQTCLTHPALCLSDSMHADRVALQDSWNCVYIEINLKLRADWGHIHVNRTQGVGGQSFFQVFTFWLDN